MQQLKVISDFNANTLCNLFNNSSLEPKLDASESGIGQVMQQLISLNKKENKSLDALMIFTPQM